MKFARRALAIGVLALLIVAFGLLLWRQQDVADWMVLRSYKPPASIAQLSQDTTMTPFAQKLFYVNQPQLEGRSGFNRHCTSEVEQSVVLGCYHGNRRGIYLYAVTDTRLSGVEQTTAAHEMLHQAYDRLSKKDRQYVDGLIESYFNNGLQDQNVKTQIEAYKKSEPDALDNEMHSLFGTEIATLPAPLEQYYKRYFNDRTKLVSYNDAYQSEFTKRKQQVAEYDQQLGALKEEIEAKEKELDDRQDAIRQKKTQLDNESDANQVDLYNADVATYNSMAQAYNRELATAKELISRYNNLVEERNAIAVQEQQLRQALDSRLTPVGGQ